MKIFLKPDGTVPPPGTLLKQPELAASLETIARDGARGFYEGEIAKKIVATVRGAGGVMTEDDLKSYRAVERPPLRGTYRGYDVISMPPPSSGGTHVIEMLNILEGFPLGSGNLGFGSPDAAHLMVEAMKLAYADRAEFLGDSDAVKVPEGARGSVAQGDRSEAGPRRARAAPEQPSDRTGQRRQHHALLGGGPHGQRGGQHHLAQFQLRREHGRRRHRHRAQQHHGRFLGEARRAQCVRVGRR
jgi:gamma-glutamyltranspeptidase/glutathione hydrolase